MNSYRVSVPVRTVTWNTHYVEAESAEAALENLRCAIRGEDLPDGTEPVPWLGWDEEGDVSDEEIYWESAEVDE
jgi:hypothetical protein